MHSLIIGFVVLIVAALLASPALAQTTQKERRFVYGLNLFDGVEYVTGFIPPSVDTIYALAGRDSVLDPKLTEVYYWPITNDVRADFTSLNELVPGTLEIGQGGRVIQTLDLTDYVVQIDPAAGMADGRVFLGDEARARHDQFLADRAGYLDRLRAYTDTQQAFNQRLDEVRAQTDAGQQVEPPTPPAEPAPLSLYSTDVGQGFALQLAAGEYQIRLRDAAGQIVADSEKRLVVFAPRREGVGYEIVPQEKWTFPEQADDPAEVVYTVAGGVVYVRPFAEQELNALAYARLKNPQDLAATANRWEWVHSAPLEGPSLAVRSSAGEERLAIGEFSVEQVPGAELGYRVVPADVQASSSGPARRPDITAFRVEAPAGRQTVSLRLLDADGREIPTGARELVVVSRVPGWQLALPVLVPLAIGASVLLWRRQQVQSARALSAEQRRLLA